MDLTPLNWADWIILGVIALSALVSTVRGFVKEAMSLVNWIIAFLVARLFYQELATLLEATVTSPAFRLMVAFAVLFIASLLVGSLLSTLMASLIRATGLTGTDRVLGIAFGALRGAILITVAIAVLRLTPLVQEGWWKGSVLIPQFMRLEAWSRAAFGEPADRLIESATREF